MMITQTTRHLIAFDSAVEEAVTWDATGDAISDSAARTIASGWASPRNTAITNLAQGSDFDRDALVDEVAREAKMILLGTPDFEDDKVCLDALIAWIDHIAGE